MNFDTLKRPGGLTRLSYIRNLNKDVLARRVLIHWQKGKETKIRSRYPSALRSRLGDAATPLSLVPIIIRNRLRAKEMTIGQHISARRQHCLLVAQDLPGRGRPGHFTLQVASIAAAGGALPTRLTRVNDGKCAKEAPRPLTRSLALRRRSQFFPR